jgi:hypothetical protein
MLMYNIFKILYNIGHIIYYKLHIMWLHLIDVEIPITNPFSISSIINDNETFNTMNDNPKDTSYQLSIKQEIRKDIIKGIREDVKEGIRDDIKGDDIAKALGHMDKDNDYIKEIKYKPYDGPTCETP